MKLNYITNNWIIGTLLGDSYIDKYNRINIGHSIKQKEYFMHKFMLLKKLNVLTPTRQPYVYSKKDKRTNSRLISYCKCKCANK